MVSYDLKNDAPKDSGREKYLSTRFWNFSTRPSDKTVLDVATDNAVCVFNDGYSSIVHKIKAMNFEIGSNSYEICLEIDKQCIKLVERSLSDQVNEARIALRSSRKEMQEQDDNLEDQLNGAGITK
ncbi:uncharacterized protein TNCV_1903581 [Trichonephila clavipes]|nr:uncharacterized protein TNCV_1903581 [Trichonephila clavipes]